MNLLDCIVTKVLSEPKFSNDKWWVDVEYDCYGVIAKGVIMLNTKEEAEKVTVNYVFLG